MINFTRLNYGFPNKKILIFLALVILFAVLFMIQKSNLNLGSLINNATNGIVATILPDSSDEQNQDVPMASDGKQIQIAYTDDNSGENIIISTDKQIYNGFSNSEVYISLTNKDDIDHNGQLLFYFPTKDDTKIKMPATVKNMQVYQSGKWQSVVISTAAIYSKDPSLKDALAKQKGIPKNMTFRGAANFSAKSGETIYFKAEINYPPGGVGEFFIEGVADRGGYGLLDPYYSSTYAYRRPLIINHNKVSTVSGTTLSNFPVLVSFTNNDIKTTTFGGQAASGSGEFVFTSSDGITTLPYEIETYSSSSGQFIGWVNVPTVSATGDTTLYMYYGGPAPGGATNQNKTGTWNADYKGVWHLPNGTTLSTAESTAGISATVVNNPTATGGKIDGAGQFVGSGSGQYFYNFTLPATVGDTFTLSAWIKSDSSASRAGFIYAGNAKLQIRAGTSVVGFYPGVATIAQGSATISTGTWYHIVYTRTAVDKNNIIYVNGSSISLSTNDKTTSYGTAAGSGVALADNVWDGSVDEARISNVVRSADWIKTEYNNQSDPSTFIGINAAQTPTRTAPSVNIRGGTNIRGGVNFH